ncbi:MAG: hypothetical protein AUK03_02435 [Anaerolineae bacterium CG2_30_64_16]|nr:MAG: hypothetical protein AUK03_02435 [Anaerolineae bacterium CG2_30_64_16]
MSSLNNTSVELHDAWQRLGQRWEDAKSLWNDPVRWNFEKEHWAPLEGQVQATQREMEQLAQVIAQAQRSVK